MNFVDQFLNDYPYVHIQTGKRAKVDGIIRTLINDGRQMLHVVADYDFTLTMYEKNGINLPSTFGVIERNERVTVCDKEMFDTKRNFLLVTRWFIASRQSRRIKNEISSD